MSSTALATVALPLGSATAAPRKRRRAETLTAGAKIGAWRVEGELGRGGMATVYAVTHSRFGKRAALKLAHRDMLSAQMTPEAFLREARIVNTVDHPGVADVFATGTFDGRPYVVMDRLAGKTLSELSRARRVERRDVLAYLGELCEVLAAAHTAGVVHRDLKLANVIVLDAPCALGRRLKLIDWGVAFVTSEPDPLTGLIAGTLTYVAPEQIRGEGVTPATDVYSLGVMAYELLTGEPPFASPDDVDLLRLHLRAAPPEPWTRWIGCPEPLAATLVAMLAKQPADRPALADVAAVFAAAREALSEAPAPVVVPAPVAPVIELRPPSLFSRARWIGPSLAVGALAAALLGLITG